MSDAARPEKAVTPSAGEPFHEVFGPAPATGHLAPAVNVGVGFTVTQGAFPSGQDLETMERLSPGAVGRIIAMSERAQQAQIEATTLAQEYARDDTKRGHWLGACLTGGAIVAGALEGAYGSTVVAVAILGVPVFSAVRALILSARGK